eukprot:459724_1
MFEYLHLNFEIKNMSRWINGGLITEIKKLNKLKFKSLSHCLKIPTNADHYISHLFGPQHPDQSAWQRGVGKTIHLLYCTALEFNETKGYFPRLHNHSDSQEFMDLFKNINKINKESGIDDACFIDKIDVKRINTYSWYFQTELIGYCSFLGGIAAQEIIKKFGKYTP